MAWKIVNFNPFAAPKPEEEELGAQPPVDLTKFGESYDPFKSFQQTDEKAKTPAFRAPEAAREASWSDVADPQQYKELGKGIVPGAIQFGGTVLQGAAAAPAAGQANAFKFGQGQQNVWERIDRGEAVPETEDAAGYQHMSPEQRRQMWADSGSAQAAFKPVPLAEQPLYKAGESVKEFAKGVLPAAPGYESAVGRQLGEGLGSMLAGLPFGAIGRIPATIFFGAGGAGEAGTRAIAYDQAEKRSGRPGLTQEQINGAALWGIAPGTTDLLPVEVILGRLRVPEPLKKPLAKAIGRIGGQAFIEGAQEGGQAFLQNVIAQDYNPNQGLTEGVAGEAGIGSGVGGIAQTAKELGGLALAGFGGRRGATAQPGQAPDAGAGDPFAQPLTPAPTGPAGGITTTGPIDVEFEDLVPADRRLPAPQVDRPAQQSGMEPPPSQPVSPQGRDGALPPAPAANTAPRGVLPSPSPLSSVPGSVDAAPAAPISSPEQAQPQPRRASQPGTGPAVDVLQFIRSKGGLKPSRELSQLDARRYPGLINRNGLDADKMREALVEAGYLQESAPDQPAITTPADVYDLLGRSMSGERIVPQLDQERDASFWMARDGRDAQRELKAAEKNFVLPELAQYDQELWGALSKVYDSLPVAEKEELIDRNRRGEDIVDLLEEKTTQNPMYYALGAPIKRARQKDALGYYSKAVEAANAIQRQSGPGAGFLNDLAKAGVTKNEIAATGLDNFLASKPAFTKQEIVDYLNQNQVQVKGSTYGFQGHPELAELRQRLREERAIVQGGKQRLEMAKANLPERAKDWPESVRTLAMDVQRAEWNIDRLERDIRNIVEPDVWGSRNGIEDRETRWKDYSLDPANPTYREDVIHLPGTADKLKQYNAFADGLKAKYGDLPLGKMPLTADENATLDRFYATTDVDNYKSGHWDEPNIVAHIRSQILKDTKGRDVFNLDELQSDWGQGIREGGARDEAKIADLEKRLGEAKGQLVEVGNSNEDWARSLSPDGFISDSGNFGWSDLHRIRDRNGPESEEAVKRIAAYREASNKESLLAAELGTAEQINTPGHPMVNTTDQWVTTAMRQVIKLAVESGADGISITPGQVQNDRFGLEKHVGEIAAMKQGDAYWVVLEDKQGQPLFRGRDGWSEYGGKTFSPEELRATIGKELADKTMANADAAPAGEYGRALRGHDLRLGGEGMRTYYDKVYPETLGKMLRKMDKSIAPEKVKVLPSSLNNSQWLRDNPGFESPMEPFDQPFTFFPITDKVRQAVEEEGQPLFALSASRDQTDTKEFKRFFKESKVTGYGGAPLQVYHATLSDFEAFKRRHANPESDMGAGFYFTDSDADAANNYSHVGGPDIRNRLSQAFDDLYDSDLRYEWEEKTEGLDPDDPGYVSYDTYVENAARERLGMSHDGVTMPVYLSIQNPVVLGQSQRYPGPDETFFDYEEVYDEETEEYGEPTGKLVEFFEAFREVAYDEFDVNPNDVDEIIAGLVDEASSMGGLSADRVITGAKSDERLFDASDDEGRLVASEIVRRALEKMGFDGIIDHTVSKKWGSENRWGGMQGVYPDTTHYIAFRPNQIKSAIGNKGTFDPDDDRITYAKSTTDEDTQQEIRQAIGAGKIFHVPQAINNAVFRGLEGAMEAVPDDHYVAVLNRIIPLNTTTADLNEMAHAQYGKPHSRLSAEQQATIEGRLEGEVGSVKIRAIFRDRAGEEFEMEGDLDTLLGVRAFYVQSGTRPGIGFTRLSLAGKFDESLRGELRHEITHALRVQGRIDPRSWGALLRHANNLSILDRDLKEYLSAIGHPLAEETEAGLTLRDAYEEAYEGMADLQERLDQESVAHLVELYSHGALGESAEPVKAMLDGIISGKYSKRAPWAEVEASLDKDLTPQIKKLLQEELDAVARSGESGTLSAAPGAGLQSGEPASARIAPRPEDFSRSSRIGESLDRKPLTGRLRDKALDRYLGGWFSPASIRQRAEMQGYTTQTWHGTRDLNFLVPDAARPNKDWGFHMATTIPLAANARIGLDNLGLMDNPWKEEGKEHRAGANVIPLLVKAKKAFRIYDLGMWTSPMHWRGTEGWVHSWQKKHGYDYEHQEAASEISEAANRFDRMAYSAETNAAFQAKLTEILEAYGYDHILYENTAEGNGEDSMIVWRPEQVRSPHDLFDPRAVGSPGLFASTPFLEADLRERLNEMLVDEAQAALFALAGKRAIGAPKAALASAERMQEKGRSADHIWQQTGWAQGPDTKWRWEIDDSKARITNLDKILAGAKASQGFFKRIMGGQQRALPAGGIQKQTNIPLINLLDHPQLYSAYPFLRQMRVDLTYGPGVQVEGALRYKSGPFTQKSGNQINVAIYKPIKVNASNPEEIKSVLMHEIQHYIQNREGFSKGAEYREPGPAKFVYDEKQGTALYDPGRDDTVLTAYGHNRQTLLKMTRPENYALKLMEQFEKLDRAKAAKEAGHKGGYPPFKDVGWAIRDAEEIIERLGLQLEEAMRVKPEDYGSSAGEWEAREVQNRLNMPAAEREKRSPFANAPAKLGNTSGQTRDYSKAYDEVMRRAETFKQIKERWAKRQPVVPGVDVVRSGESDLEYGNGNFIEGTDPTFVLAHPDENNATKLILAKEFIEKPYPEQKRIMDGIMRDLRKRNIIVSGAKANTYEIQDQDIAFWKRYDPTKIAFDLRLYRDEIMEKARERYGDDVEVNINVDNGTVRVTTPQMKADAQQAQIDFDKADAAVGKMQDQLNQKYGWDYLSNMTKQEKDRYEALEKKSYDLEMKTTEEPFDWLDLDFIFEGRDSHARPPGVDYETWARAVAEEQLLAMGKMPRPGEEVDFDDLIPSQ